MVKKVEIITTEVIDLDEIQSEINGLQDLHDSIVYIEQSEDYPQDVNDLIDNDNADKYMKKAEILNDKAMKQEDLDNYKKLK